MSQATAQVSSSSSRLVRALAALDVSDARVSHHQFSARLGRLFDLSDSLDLARLHARLGRLPFERSGVTAEALRQDFLSSREAILGAVLRGFDPGRAPARLSFPLEQDAPPADIDAAVAACERFYAAQQRDLDFRVRNLQSWVREALAGLSPQLAQLAALDEGLGDTLELQMRRLYPTVAGLLGKRIRYLLLGQRNESTDGTSAWSDTLRQIRSESRELLLAEAESRLLPVLGLMEALDHSDEETT